MINSYLNASHVSLSHPIGYISRDYNNQTLKDRDTTETLKDEQNLMIVSIIGYCRIFDLSVTSRLPNKLLCNHLAPDLTY